MGFSIKSLIQPVLTAVGTAVGGPVGGAIGSTVGGFLGGAGDLVADNAGAIASGYGAYRGAEMTNATNLQIAREATTAEKLMQQTAIDATGRFQERQIGAADAMAQRQMDFQERMANTGFSRAVVDLKRAGLNPILAAGAQSPAAQGASVAPAGAAGTSGRAHTATMLDKLGAALSTAIRVKGLQKELQTADAQIGNLNEQQKLTAQQGVVAGRNADLVGAQVEKTHAETARVRAETDIAYENQRIRRREAEDTEKYGTSKVGQEAAGVERVIRRLYNYLRGRSND